MQRLYRKPIYLDTCIAKNLLGFDENPDEIGKLYNKNILIKYIKHHGCILTVFTMFEILRDEKISNSKILDNLKKLNYEILVPYDIVNADFTLNYKNEMGNSFKRNSFIKIINEKILDYSSKFYSDILIYPFILNLYAILYTLKKKDIKISYQIINKKVAIIAKTLADRIKILFEDVGIYQKGPMKKQLNKVYKWITDITVKWFKEDVDILCKITNIENCYLVCDKYLERINNCDFNEPISVKGKNNIFANGDFDFLYILEKSTYNMTNKSFNREDWIKKFIEFNRQTISKIYKMQEKNFVIDEYFFISMYEFHFQHLIDKRGNMNPDLSFKNMIDTNDIIDLLSLNFSENNKGVFLTTDHKIQKIIRRYYDKERLNIFNLFIK